MCHVLQRFLQKDIAGRRAPLGISLARNAPRKAPPKSFAETMRPLANSRSWALSLYYFLTFGGFVAMAVYLTIFLTESFKLTPQHAGLRTAGFVLLATATRPRGGIPADKAGGRTILKWVFPATALRSDLTAILRDSPATCRPVRHLRWRFRQRRKSQRKRRRHFRDR